MKKLYLKIKNRIDGFYQYKDLLALLVERDLKLKYRRSFLGYLWSILNPLLSMAVQAVVFTSIFRNSIENFPVYLICGNILFSFMRESSTQALTSVIDNAALLKKTYVPKYIFTLSKITSGLVNFVLSLGALLIVMIVTGVPFRWENLLAIVPILELYVFCVGLGLLVASLTVFFRDMKNLWSVVTLAWMYMTPIFYSLESFYQGDVMKMAGISMLIRRFNPMYMYIQQFRALIMNYRPAWEVPTVVLMGRGALVAIIMLIVGIIVFNRTEDKFILYI